MTPSAAAGEMPQDAELRRGTQAHLRAVVDAILATGELDDPRWNELAVVFSVSGGGRNFGNSGYAYGENGAWWAVSFPVPAVKEPVLDLLADLRERYTPRRFGATQRGDNATAIGRFGEPGDHGGHLVAHRLMGDTPD